jgi:hypothetical protein
MAECDQLGILGLLGTKEEEGQTEKVTDDKVDEGPQLPTCRMPSHRHEGSRVDQSSAQNPWSRR